MALSKDYFIKEMRRRYPNLEDTPDEYVYIYGKQQNPTIAIEPFSDTVSGDPIMEPQSPNEDQTINTAPWYFDYIDYGIDEDSYKWRQMAYNQSLQGMSEQLLTGKQRFDLDDYESHIVEDIVATAASFFMPLDIISMIGGGSAATKGYNLIAPFAKKQLGKKATSKFLSNEGLKKSAPIAAQMVESAGSLGAYEGAIGYVNAKNEGKDEMASIGEAVKGVAHGGFLGAVTGGISKGFSGKHSELLKKEAGEFVTKSGKASGLTTPEKFTKAITSKTGAIATEVGAFQTASVAENLMSTGELPDAETFLYELTFNAGLIGALKGSGKVIKKANEFIREKAPSMRKSNLLDATLESDAFSSLDNNIKKQIKDGLIGADEGAEISKAISEVREVNKNSLKEKSIGLNGIIDFIDNVIPNILKSKRADKDTAKTLRDVKIGINAQKEAIEMIRDKRKSELGNAERQSLDRIIKEAEENLRLLDDVEAKIDEGIYVQGKASKAVERTVPLGRKKIIEIADKYGLDLEDLFDSPKPKPGDVILTESLFKNKKKWTKEEKLIASRNIDKFLSESNLEPIVQKAPKIDPNKPIQIDTKIKQTKQQKQLKEDLRNKIRATRDSLGLKDINIVKTISDKMNIDIPKKNIRLRDITDVEVLKNIDLVISKINPKNNKNLKTKDYLSTAVDVIEINRRKGVAPKAFKEILEGLGVKDGKLNNASTRQLTEYFNIVKEGLKDAPRAKSSGDIIKGTEKSVATTPLVARLVMPVSNLLRSYGGESGKKIANLIDGHNRLEDLYYGYADRVMTQIKDLYKNKKEYVSDLNNLWLIDTQRRKDMIKNFPEKLTDSNKEFIKNLETKGSLQSQMRDQFRKVMDFYWNSISKEARKWNNPAELAELKKRLSKKYVDDYITRRVSKKALNAIADNNDILKGNKSFKESLKQAAINKAKKDLEKKGIDINLAKDRIAKEADKNLNNEKFVNDFFANMYDAMRFGYEQMANPYMLERSLYLGEFIKDSSGKLIQTYETKFSKSGEMYLRKMSKYLSSIRYFPEYTGIGGKYTVPKAKAILGLSKNNELGNYMETAVRRNIGLAESGIDRSVLTTLQNAGRFSAVAGLSSPLSGVKNLFLATAQIYGNTNLRSTVHGFRQILNKEAELYAREVGAISSATKYMELSSWQEKIFKYNFMTTSENWARIASIYAKKMYNQNLIDQLKGSKQGVFKARNNKIANSELLKSGITQDQINFLVSYEPSSANKLAKNRYLDINITLDRNAHTRLQGGTSVGQMPLWASAEIAKPFTLFQRMAYAATWNSYNNYLVPIKKNKNFMPLLRYGAASYVSGASLYYIYETIFDTQPPKSLDEDKLFSNAIMNLWKAETLGLFTEAINLYGGYNQGFMPLQTPVIVRHMQNATKSFLHWYHGDKTFATSADEFTKSYFVAWGQARKALDRLTNPYATKMKKLNTIKRVFLKEQGKNMQFNDKYGRDRLPYYHKLRLEFYKGGDDMWKAYYAAYNYLVTDELKDREILNPSRAQALASHKNATKLLRQQIQRYKPLSLSKTSLTDEDPSLQEKFKEYLDDDSKAMLESLNNDYGYRFRKLSKQLRENYDQSTVLPYKFNIK